MYIIYQELSAGFPIFHINAPGQEDGAQTLPADYEYPSMEQLAEQVQEVINHFKIVKYIGLGVGLGANVLTRHSLAYPERVESLVLVNTVITKAGWVEWGYQKRNVSHLRTTGITQTVQEYLLWHHLGDDYNDRAHDLLQVYKDYFAHNVNPLNLAGLVEQYIWRSDIPLHRDSSSALGGLVKGTMLEAPVLNLVGIHAASEIIEGTVTFNGSLEPSKANWIKVQVGAGDLTRGSQWLKYFHGVATPAIPASKELLWAPLLHKEPARSKTRAKYCWRSNSYTA